MLDLIKIKLNRIGNADYGKVPRQLVLKGTIMWDTSPVRLLKLAQDVGKWVGPSMLVSRSSPTQVVGSHDQARGDIQRPQTSTDQLE